MPPCAVIRDVMHDLEGAKRGHDPLSEWIHLGAGHGHGSQLSNLQQFWKASGLWRHHGTHIFGAKSNG